MNVAIVGLGYVGTVSAACFAQEGHVVVGVDVNEAKVAQINDGLSPIVESELGDLIRSGVASGRLSATTDGCRPSRIAGTQIHLTKGRDNYRDNQVGAKGGAVALEW